MVILVRYGELSLKGQLRRKFEDVLVSNMKRVMRVEGYGGRIEREWGRLYVFPKEGKEKGKKKEKKEETDVSKEEKKEEKEREEEYREEKLARRLSFVFGVVSTSVAVECEAELNTIAERAKEVLGDRVKGRTFAVRARRSGEHVFTSMDVARKVGEELRRAGGVVKLKEPEVEVHVEVRGEKAYIFTEIFRGFGGLPVGTQGRVLAMDGIQPGSP